jgi:DNA (cytosine-5)-methyltransferase 1
VTDLSVVEICAGAGGQSLGLHLAGFRHELAVELDAKAAATLRGNLARLAERDGLRAPIVAEGDVADEDVWRPEDYKQVSLLAGGVPCPPFSKAGERKGSQDERDLFAWAVEAAGRMDPDAVLLENVDGLSEKRFAGYRQAVLDRFAEMGYLADWKRLEARDYGVPQLRPRFILVALTREFAPYFAWPEPTPTVQTLGAALYDLMAENGWPGAAAWAERANKIAPTIVGGSKKHGGPDLGPTRAKAEWRTLGVDGLGIADAAPGPGSPVNHLPRLTLDMVARLQGWSGSDYHWEFRTGYGHKTATYRQIGNAFPAPVARAVGLAIAAALRKEGEPVGTHGLAETFHDEVYRALREHGGFMSIVGIRNALGKSVDADEIERRLEFLKRDFVVHERARGGKPTYRIGEWRAFLGQENHFRHAAFDGKLRAKIS